MPELPEVETVRRGLEAALAGRRLRSVAVRREGLRLPFPVDLGQRLTGSRILSVGRRAKYALLHTDRDDVMLLHLGMSGRVRMSAPPFPEPGKHDHLLLETEDDRRLTLNDARRFGLVLLLRAADLFDHPLLAGLGPEPLEPAFDADLLHQALLRRNSPLKAALLDQRLVAGLGNIYVVEALHRSGLSPLRIAASLGPDEAEKLVRAIRAVLLEAIAAGGSTLRDHAAITGELGYFQHGFQVYDRAGHPCLMTGCSGTVRLIRQAGRSSFYCPACQH